MDADNSTDKAIDSNSPCSHKNGNNVLNHHLDKEQEEISSVTILQQKLKSKDGKEKELRSDFEKFQKQHVNKLPKNIIAEINEIENQCSKVRRRSSSNLFGSKRNSNTVKFLVRRFLSFIYYRNMGKL